VVSFILCCSSCCIIVVLGYAVCCIEFRCHIKSVMFPEVGGNAAGGGGMKCVVAVMVVCV